MGAAMEPAVPTADGVLQFKPRDIVHRAPKHVYASTVHQDALPAIVVDNGSYHCRVGWGTEPEPLVDVRSLVSKPRVRATGYGGTIVGEYSADAVKAFDSSRSTAVRSAFDGDVVYQFETQEAVLDYAFDRLSIEGGQVSHPVVLTECLLNPLYARQKIADLLFEAYGVPAIAFGTDALFSHRFNQDLGRCGPDGLIVSSGHSASHVIPVVDGNPLLEASFRLPLAGLQTTTYLQNLLALKHPQHGAAISWDRAEEVKERHCYVAEDYAVELKKYQDAPGWVAQQTACYQLPWVAAPPPVEMSAEEKARKAEIKERNRERLKEMAAAKKATRITNLEADVAGLEHLLAATEGATDARARAFLQQTGYQSRTEVAEFLAKNEATLRRLRGEESTPPKEEEEDPADMHFPLLEVPDSQLSAEEIGEKKRQRFQKNMAEGRARARQKRTEEQQKREQQRAEEEDKYREDPDGYMEALHGKRAALLERVESRKRRRLTRTSEEPGEAAGTVTGKGATGRGERLSAAQRERMRLLATAAFDGGKGEDTFGANDSDWGLYAKMAAPSAGGDSDEAEEDEAELAATTARLQELDPFFKPGAGNGTASPPSIRAPTAEDFQVRVGIERVRAPEIIFQPSMVGVDQAGVGELLSVVLRRLPDALRERVATGGVFLTGGNTTYPGLDARIAAEYRSARPLGAPIKIWRANNPLLDAWHGAAKFSSSPEFSLQTFTKADYDEKGSDWLRTYRLDYSIH